MRSGGIAASASALYLPAAISMEVTYMGDVLDNEKYIICESEVPKLEKVDKDNSRKPRY